jgi:hypothetical protein
MAWFRGRRRTRGVWRRSGVGRYRRGYARRGREFRLVIQAPRGILPAAAAPYRGLRRRRSRRF